MKVVITGASGQMGKAFAQVWPEAELWDRNDLDLTASLTEIRERVECAQADILINAAAYTAVDRAETELELAYQINAHAVLAIANGCNSASTRLLQISTDYVFSGGLPSETSTLSDDPRVRPVSVYGWSKLAGEQAARLAYDSMIVRTSWLYGDGQNFVQTMRRLGRKLSTVEVVHDQIGRPTSALDLALAIKGFANQTAWPATVNFQNSGSIVSWCEFAQAIFEEDDLATLAVPVTSAVYAEQKRANGNAFADRPSNSVFNLDHIESLMDDIRDWRSALKEYIARTPAPE